VSTHVRAFASVETPVDRAAVPGFVESDFNPMVHDVASACLAGQDFDGDRLAVVLASLMGDATTTDLASTLLAAGQVHNPLLFMQATANSILGYVSREFDITGPLISLSSTDHELFAVADLVLTDPDLDAVLTISVELSPNPRTAQAYRMLGASPPERDVATAFLLERATEDM